MGRARGGRAVQEGEKPVKRFIVASGLTLAAALPAHALEPDVNLSGTFGLGLSWYEDNNVNSGTVTNLDLSNNASNFRITAAAQEVGLRAFMAYERGASNDRNEQQGTGIEDVREFFGGVSGRYGTLLYGRKATDYRLAGERLDPFYNTSLAGFNGQFASEGASYGLSGFTNGYTSNTIAYRSPALYGFSGNVGTYVNDNNSQGSGDKADFAGGIAYANSGWRGLDVGVQVLDINGNVVQPPPFGNVNAYRLHGTLGEKLWALGFSYELVDVAAEAKARQYALVSGSYQVMQELRIALTYGHVSNTPDTVNGYDGNGGAIGLFYDVTKNLSTYAGARHVVLTNGNQNATTTAAAGVKFIFDVDL
jgi:predicted porin